jgi:hypothetical protein
VASGRREYLRNPGAETFLRSSVKLPIPSMADLAAQLLRAREERGGLREEGSARVSLQGPDKKVLKEPLGQFPPFSLEGEWAPGTE